MKMTAMSLQEFENFLKRSKEECAQERSLDSGLAIDECRAFEELEFVRLLPQGIETPEHFFFNLKDVSGVNAGYLWFGVRVANEKKQIFIFDISVDENRRGLGLGKFMIQWLEGETYRMGLTEIALHVLGSNKAARHLYDSTGFVTTNIYMSKKIEGFNEVHSNS